MKRDLNRKEKMMSEQSEQTEEFRTNDKSPSRSLYLKLLGATVGTKETGGPCNGDYNVNGDISRFKDGLLHGGADAEGEAQPAVELLDGHTEWWKEGLLHRDGGPAVVTGHGTWEEFWLRGELVMIRVFGPVGITGVQKG
jgi:hypothetical protein